MSITFLLIITNICSASQTIGNSIIFDSSFGFGIKSVTDVQPVKIGMYVFPRSITYESLENLIDVPPKVRIVLWGINEDGTTNGNTKATDFVIYLNRGRGNISPFPSFALNKGYYEWSYWPSKVGQSTIVAILLSIDSKSGLRKTSTITVAIRHLTPPKRKVLYQRVID